MYQRRASRSAYHAGSGRMVKPISLPSFFFPFSVSSHFRWRQRTVGHLGFTFQPIARLQTKTGQWRARLRPPTRESPQSSTPPPSSGKNLLDRNEEKRKKKRMESCAALPLLPLISGVYLLSTGIVAVEEISTTRHQIYKYKVTGQRTSKP